MIEENEHEKEKEVSSRAAKIASEWLAWKELKHKQDLAAKDKQIEAARLQTEAVDEKISQAIIDNESKHSQREKQFELRHGRILSDNRKLMDQVEATKDIREHTARAERYSGRICLT